MKRTRKILLGTLIGLVLLYLVLIIIAYLSPICHIRPHQLMNWQGKMIDSSR